MITFVITNKHTKITISTAMRERIKQVIEREGMSQSQFADFIEVNRPTLSHILAGRNNPSLEVIMKIHQKFPKISTDWLLDGVGPYEVNGTTEQPSTALAEEQPSGIAVAESYLQNDSSFIPPSAAQGEQPKSRFYQGELFAENAIFAAESTGAQKNRKEMPLQTTPKAPYLSDTQIEYAKKSLQRKIVEIKIFYDDGTYETFKQ